MKKRTFFNQGLTLVEIIIGVALIGITVISLIPAFTLGFTQIYHSGNRTETLYEIQSVITGTPQIGEEEELQLHYGNKTIEIPITILEVEREFNQRTGAKVAILMFRFSGINSN